MSESKVQTTDARGPSTPSPAYSETVDPRTGPTPPIVFEELTVRTGRPLSPVLTAAVSRGSPLAEEFRKLRSRVKAIAEQRPFRCVGIVSAAAGEGKTTTAFGLAAALAQEDRRVLLIEADLRRRSLDRNLRLNPGAGLVEFLEGNSLAVSARRLGSRGPFLLSAGRASLDRPELLASARMARLLDAARQSFEFIVVDCAPLIPVADSVLLQDMLDGFLFVIRARQVPREMLLRALGPLKAGKVQGVVFRAARGILRRDDRYGYRDEYSIEEPARPSAGPAAAAAGGTAAGLTFHEEAGKKGRMLATVVIAAALLVGAGGWLLPRRSAHALAPASASPSTLSAEAAAAMQRVRELEEKLKTIAAEKGAAESKAAEDAKKKLEAQAAARGRKVDAGAMEKAQEDARRNAQAENDRKAQEEKKRLQDEQRVAEARLAEERRPADEEGAKTAAAAMLSPPPLPPAGTVAAAVAVIPPSAPAVKPGTLVSLSDPGVTPPVAQSVPRLHYPPIAERAHVEGTVELSILVDEKGSVVDAKVVTAAGGKAGLDAAAIDNVKGRRYLPATKDGIPVKVWYPVNVRFVLLKR